jgi:hypothetical protein
MINDQLRALRTLVDKLEEIALAIPAQNWPSSFDALLDGWELAMKTCCAGGSSREEHCGVEEAP